MTKAPSSLRRGTQRLQSGERVLQVLEHVGGDDRRQTGPLPTRRTKVELVEVADDHALANFQQLGHAGIELDPHHRAAAFTSARDM